MHIHGGNVREFATKTIRVWLDGTELDTSLIEEANEEDGYLIMFVPDKDKGLFVDPRNEEIRRMRLSGRVDITLGGAELPREKMLECSNLYRVFKNKN